jgi:molecular chaperone DnaK (HSP70)
VLVIDVGTSSTSAVLVAGGETRMLPEPVSGAYAWPSAVYWDGQQMLVGTLAERKKRADPAGYGEDFKSNLSQDTAVQLGARRFRPVEQMAAVLATLRAEAERLHEGPVIRAVVTVPASYATGDPRRAWMIAAAEAAGFTTVELLPEPVAAAFAPLTGAGFHQGDLVLLYDLGGGTFDTALMRIGATAPEVLGHNAVDNCGGRHIDALLASRIAADGRQWLDPLVAGAGATRPPAGPDTPAPTASPATLRLTMAVNEFAQRIKHQLSDAPMVEDFLMPTTPAYRMTRDELAALAAPVLDRTVACCRELLDRLGVPVERINTVLLVGGGSRMPAVTDTLARSLGRPLRRAEEPELATVRGAAHWLTYSGARMVPATVAPGRTLPLGFAVPGGSARLLRWFVEPGDRYPAGQPLARVRLPGGALWDLTAAADGVIDRLLVSAGVDVTAHQWLALSRQP